MLHALRRLLAHSWFPLFALVMSGSVNPVWAQVQRPAKLPLPSLAAESAVGTSIPAYAVDPLELLPVNPPATLSLDQILKQGRELERQDRWTDALHLYLDNKRAHRDDTGLLRRLDVCRAYVDVQRRYGDQSFRQAALEMPFSEAFGLYEEVLGKIDTYYVDNPPWLQLCDRGVLSLQIALQNSECQRLFGTIDRAELKQFLTTIRGLRPVTPNKQQVLAFVSQVCKTAEKQLGLRSPHVALEYVAGAVGALDDYSAFLTPAQFSEVNSQIEGNFVGLGVELKPIAKALKIVKVLSGSPAAKAGIQDGDLIVAVDGHSTEEVDPEAAADMLQGEEGSVVQVDVQRAGQPVRSVKVTRAHVEIPSVEGVKLVDVTNRVGYFKLNCFQKTTDADVNQAMWQLHNQGMKSLVVDLSGNPGGLLESAVELADKFVEKGVLLTTKGRNPGEDFSFSAQLGGTWRVPLVVMIDHDSASASEIFAGAIRDHHRGTLVGTRSYGKGSVQGIFPLTHGNAGLRLTTARFFSPSGRKISDQGVEPHLEAPKERSLQAAIETARLATRR